MSAREGHNSGIAGDVLRSGVERIERLLEEKKGLQDDISEIKARLKAQGFEPKIVNEVLRRRKLDSATRDAFDSLVALYEGVFG